MSILLTKSLPLGKQSIEIVVKYDSATNTVDEIKSIWLIEREKQIPIGKIMMRYFDEAVNKIIDETNWPEVYSDFMECKVEGGDVDDTIMAAIRKHAKYLE